MTQNLLRTTVIAVILAFTHAGAANAQEAQERFAARPYEFRNSCASCHGDDGRGATLGNLKGKGWGLGPIVQYSREYWGVPVTAALRGQKVMQHRNRTDDDSVMFNFFVSF